MCQTPPPYVRTDVGSWISFALWGTVIGCWALVFGWALLIGAILAVEALLQYWWVTLLGAAFITGLLYIFGRSSE